MQTDKSETEQIENAVAAAVAEGEPKGSKFLRLLDTPHFTPVQNQRKYTNRDGSSVVTVANVQIPIKGLNATLAGSIKLTKYPKRPAVASFAFKAGGPVPLDDAANAELIAYRKSIAELYAKGQNGPISVGVSADAVAVKVDGFDDDDE